jgi:hypothetical protein
MLVQLPSGGWNDMSCLETYADRYAPLLNDARLDVEEFLATGAVGRAQRLSAATGQRFNDARLPQFFTGDLDAMVVLIHLNPKAGPTPTWHSSVQSFEDWFSSFRHFGERMNGPDSPRIHKSPFDHKQIRFLKPLGHIDFVPEKKPEDRFTNLQRVIDRKLQLELVPYASNSFSTRGFTPQVLERHLQRILATVVEAPREYVLFCGSVFEPVLGEYVDRWHRFSLRKKNGEMTRQVYRFANLDLPHDGGHVRAGLAPSWAQQGIPMTAYAEELRDRYHAS